MFGAAEAPRGVLSAAAFPGYLLTLDYPGKRILIRKGALPPADSRTSWDFTAEQVLPSAIVKVSGVEVRVHVDSGSPGSVTLPTKYMKEIKLASEPVQQGRMQTPGGVFPVWSAKIDAPVELGPFKLDVTNVQFSDVNPVPGPPVGNLGFQVLKRFRITFDSKNRRIAFAE